MSSKQDATGVRTAQDLERKYDLASLVGIKKAVEKTQTGLNNTNAELLEFINSTVENIEELQKQVDGNITTWFYNGVPTISNAPAKDWTTNEEKINHLGDLYYDQNTGYAYRWAYINNAYEWTRIVDADVTEALAVANAAQDTADSKRRIFVVQPTPPYDVGDVWIFNDSDLYRCSVSRESGTFNSLDWVIATKYTDDTVANNVKAELDSYKELVQTTYVTQSSFTTANNEIKGQVREISVQVGMKNSIFTIQPVPPYIVGDAYVVNDKVYICKVPREIGEIYNASDWELDIDNSDLVNQSTFDQTATEIRAEVSSVSKKVDGQDTKIATISESVEDISAKLSNIADITTSGETSYAKLNLSGINESEPIYLRVFPTTKNISYLYPNTGLYPETELFPTIRTLRFTNTTTNEVIDYEIPDDLLFYDEDTYDELILDYGTESCQIIKKCGYNEDGTVKALDEVVINDYEYPKILLTTGDYTISLLSYSNGYLFARLMTANYYTTQFYTKVETEAKINESANSITLSVDQKLYSANNKIDNNYDTLNSKIDLTESSIKSEVSTNYSTKNELNKAKSDLTGEISTLNTTLSSSISQTDSKISAEVTRATNKENQITGSLELKLDKTDNDQVVSMINASADNVIINANKVNLNGLVKVTDLSTQGQTTINGSNITTGTIDATKVSVTNLNASNIKSGSINADLIGSNTITTDKINSNAITSDKISSSAITADKIETNAITADKISSNAITTDKIAANSITTNKINAEAITGDKIEAGAITAEKINVGAITSDKIEAGAITTDKISSNAITSEKIEAASITTDKISTNAVTTEKIKSGAITADKIEAGAITASKISSGAITSDKLSATAITGKTISGGTISGSKLSGTTGKIGGWTIASSQLTGLSSGYAVTMSPSTLKCGPNNTYSMTWYQVCDKLRETSDERLKDNITKLNETYEQFYNDLNPVTFNYKEEEKTHIGFVAQEMLENQKNNNVENLDIVKKYDEYYSLNKEEIIALNTWQIQKLKKEIELLKEEISSLKESSK